MNNNLTLNKKKILKYFLIFIFSISFFIFLYSFNKIDRVQLINKEGTTFEKAEVIEIIDSASTDNTQKQDLKVKILSGDYKNKIINATNYPGYLHGADCRENMKVIISLSVSDNTYSASVYSYYRAPIIYGFVLFFVLVLFLIGKKKGLKSALGLAFTFICIIFLFIPMIYKGYSPFLSSVIVVILTTIVTMLLIDGLTIKTISAMISTILGVILSGLIAASFSYFSKISGYNVADIEELVFIANNTSVKIGSLLFSGILIASLGAVMDVSMSISSTINELHEKSPQLSQIELFKSGLNVGSDMIGTMSNTLILAFTGTSLNTLLLNYCYCLQYNQIINMYSIGIEIMQGLSGSIGVILTVPIVSFFSSKLQKSKYADLLT